MRPRPPRTPPRAACAARRVLAYRQREGGFNSLDELERIPGVPRAQLDELRRKLTV